MKPGDMCTIWTGRGSLSDPRKWLIGIVLWKKKLKHRNEPCYQVLWHDLGPDEVWYLEREISLDNHPAVKS